MVINLFTIDFISISINFISVITMSWIAVPLGILKEYHKTLFDPALPIIKQNTLREMTFGLVCKVFLEFETDLPKVMSLKINAFQYVDANFTLIAILTLSLILYPKESFRRVLPIVAKIYRPWCMAGIWRYRRIANIW